MLSGSSFVAVGSSRQAAVPAEPVSRVRRLDLRPVFPLCVRLRQLCLSRRLPPHSRPCLLSVTLALSSPAVRSLVGFEVSRFPCLAACFLTCR